MRQPKNIKELTPSEKGNIIWLSKSGHAPEAIARETRLPLSIVSDVLYIEAGTNFIMDTSLGGE